MISTSSSWWSWTMDRGGARHEAGGRFLASGIVTADPDQGYIFYITKHPYKGGFVQINIDRERQA
jgi:hypothetical protein